MRLRVRWPAPPAGDRRPVYRRQWRLVLFGVLLLLAALGGGTTGYFLRFDMPDVRALENYNPPQMTRVVSGDGVELGAFAEERRILIDYGEIPAAFRQAVIAAEDANFLRHTGIDFPALVRAAWRDLKSMRLAQGASTVTQQLARNLFLHPDKTIKRKVQEALLALQIEREYTKPEILRFYCNQIYMGHGRYGLEAASRYYFGKPARELTLPEAATLAGVIQRPEALSPLRHPDRAMRRRNYVLRRMVEEGYIDQQTADAVGAQPLTTAARGESHDIAPFYVEEVRRWLQERFGSSSLYSAGLDVRTTLDPELQTAANDAVDRGLRQLDRRQGWRGVAARVPAGTDAGTWEPEAWAAGLEPGRVADGVVVEVERQAARVRVGPWSGTLGPDEVAWTGRQADLRRLFQRGDVIRVRPGTPSETAEVPLELTQEPEVEAALVALDPRSGEILALVGGFDFARSEYDRAIQAERQTGSAFKPFVYAAALEAGFTLADTLIDEPTVFLDPQNPQPYQPENYGHDYHGAITLREALEKSANIATVKLLDAVGYQPVIDMAHRLGIERRLAPYPSLALGAFETSLLELTAAYGALANQGVLVEPHFVREVRDRDGSTLVEVEPEIREAVSPQLAYLMNRVLTGVITDGTGRAASALGQHVAGKTGTTDENTDAWFIGYTTDLAVGVWVGFDEPKSLGRRETGAQAALPIWQALMERALAEREPVEFPVPPGVAFVTVDRATGLKASQRAACSQTISEAFLAGSEPAEWCSFEHHQRARLPYPFQRYPLDEDGELLLPVGDLDRLLGREPAALAAGGRRLEVTTEHGVVPVAVELVASPGESDPASDPRLAAFDVDGWVGQDGRRARVVWMDGRPAALRAGG